MKQKEDVQGLTQGVHLYFRVVPDGEEDVNTLGDKQAAVLAGNIVFQHDIDENLVESSVVQLVFLLFIRQLHHFLKELFFLLTQSIRLDASDVVVEFVNALQGYQRVAVDFKNEKVLLAARFHFPDFKEE